MFRSGTQEQRKQRNTQIVKHSNICFAISFCIVAFPLGGFIRNMNILLGNILLIFIYLSLGRGAGEGDKRFLG